MKNKLLITVFTPSYNRGSLLKILFSSLQSQSYTNFEWLIVDDGSTDNTETIVNSLRGKSSFEINYYKQENQGKHIAINKGVSLARGELFYIVDNDDRLPWNSLEIIVKKYKLISNQDAIAGIVGLKYLFSGVPVGTPPLDQDLICNAFEYRYKYKVYGDRAEVFKTQVLKEFPFPKFNNEKFLPESIVWNRIALKYSLLYFNESIYECEYRDDGLSAQSIRLRRKNPIGILNLYSELANAPNIGIPYRWKAYINFWRFYFCSNSHFRENLKLIKHFSAYLFLPIGLLMFLKDYNQSK